jgi:hypothetical protein
MAKLGLVDAVKISDLTGDMRILHAFAEAVGHRAVKVEIPEADSAAGPGRRDELLREGNG